MWNLQEFRFNRQAVLHRWFQVRMCRIKFILLLTQAYSYSGDPNLGLCMRSRTIPDFFDGLFHVLNVRTKISQSIIFLALPELFCPSVQLLWSKYIQERFCRVFNTFLTVFNFKSKEMRFLRLLTLFAWIRIRTLPLMLPSSVFTSLRSIFISVIRVLKVFSSRCFFLNVGTVR